MFDAVLRTMMDDVRLRMRGRRTGARSAIGWPNSHQ